MESNKYRSISSILREMSANRNTELRRKVVNVARPDDADPTSEKSKLAKQAEIKTKIIDEESLGDHEKLKSYADKHGGIDKDDFHHAADLMKKGDVGGLKSKLKKMDTDPRDHVISHVDKKHHSSLGFHVKEEVEIDEVSKELIGQVNKKRTLQKIPSKTAAAADTLNRGLMRAAGITPPTSYKPPKIEEVATDVGPNQGPMESKKKDKKSDEDLLDAGKVKGGGKTEVDLNPKTVDDTEEGSRETEDSKKARKSANKEIGAKGMKEEAMFKSDKTFGLSGSLIDAVKSVISEKKKMTKADIAAMEEPKDKIDAKDFAALRAGKHKKMMESTCDKCGDGPCQCDVKEEAISEAMPAGVIKDKQKYAAMSNKEIADRFKHHTDEVLKNLAHRHGYGGPGTAGYNHYVNRKKAGMNEEVESVDEAILGGSKNQRDAAKFQQNSKERIAKMMRDEKARKAAEAKKTQKEEVEQIDELSPATLGSYVKKASNDVALSGLDAGRNRASTEYYKVAKKKMSDRLSNIAKATDRLTKEEVEQIDELSRGAVEKYHDASWLQRRKLKRDHSTIYGTDPEKQKQIDKRERGLALAQKKMHKEEVEIDEAERSKKYLGTFKSPDEAKEILAKSPHGAKHLRIRARLGKDNPNKALYAKGGPLKTRSSQDIKTAHGTRFDVYSRKNEEVEFTPDELAHIESIMGDKE